MNRVEDINRGVRDVKPLESVEIPSLEGRVSAEEWAIRLDLAKGKPAQEWSYGFGTCRKAGAGSSSGGVDCHGCER